MPFHGAYDESQDILVFTFGGVADVDDVAPFTEEALRLACQHECRRILSDFRGAKMGLSPKEILDLTEWFQDSGIDDRWKRAILVERQVGGFLVHETVARDRGHNVRVFTDQEDALNWLLWQSIH